ncbi:Plbd1 [Symbiodinium natans]|uniref:Phospholipase B-like n=1 Tax=Symbiodinium natans TaxID=878477 RepID=A0A812KL67_9DINO|nr:Plbd1 [Symbiodinium natans]
MKLSVLAMATSRLLAPRTAVCEKPFEPNGTPLVWWHYNGNGGLQPGKGLSGTYAAFQDHVQLEGWGHLHMQAEATLEGAYAAGFLEGYMTSVHIFEHYVSWLQAQFGQVSVHAGGSMRHAWTAQGGRVRKFIEDNDRWVRQQVAENHASPYWQTVGRLMAQADGLLAGQQAATRNTTAMQLRRTDMLLLLASGDMYDIQPAVHQEKRVNWAALDAANFMKEFHKGVSCSALVTYSEDAVRAGHTTWTSYNNMLRIYKRVTWAIRGRPVHKVAFSSRPGYLYSKDDFYTLPLQRMVVMETTNAIFNNSLYDKVRPEALMVWQRVPVSNFLAQDGPHWAKLFSRHNSGTYNNMWIAITLDRASKSSLEDGFLTIAEQIPGEVKVTDVTPVVRKQGYFSSYNVPYDAGIYEAAGYPRHVERMGPENSYMNCSRAKIFRRDAPEARGSMQAFKRVMGSNNYQADPESHGDPSKAIMARGDLSPYRPELFGAVDLKVTEAVPGGEGWDGIAWARSGPTTDNQPPFSWLNIPDGEPVLHLGQPDVFNFDFIPMAFHDAEGIAAPIDSLGDSDGVRIAQRRREGKRAPEENHLQWLVPISTAAAASPMKVTPFSLGLCAAGAIGFLSLVLRPVRQHSHVPGEEESVYFLHA